MGFWLAVSVYGERPTVVKRGCPCFCFICVGIFENLLFFGWASRSQRTLQPPGSSQSSNSIAYGRVACATAEKLQHSRPGNSPLSQPRSVHIDSKTTTGNPRAFTAERLSRKYPGPGALRASFGTGPFANTAHRAASSDGSGWPRTGQRFTQAAPRSGPVRVQQWPPRGPSSPALSLFVLLGPAASCYF